jgi:hypothetical protein
MKNKLPSYAAEYAATVGWPIFPLEPRGKKPLTAHGVHDASTDPDLVLRWWKQWPTANIGIATGPSSALVGLDIDGNEGRESLAALEARYGALGETLTAQSGRADGGEHHYFLYAEDDIGNSAGRIAPKLDVRGQGGYLILPPSVHPSGRLYQWLQCVELAPLPDWLANLMRATPTPSPRLTKTSASVDLAKRARIYIAAAEGAEEGARNDACFQMAGHIAAFVDANGSRLEEAVIRDLLQDFNRRCVPPLGDKELQQVVASALRNGTPRELKTNRPQNYRQLALRGREVVYG